MNPQLGQLIMIGVSGYSLTTEEKKFIVENNICGVTLFGRNLKEPEQMFTTHIDIGSSMLLLLRLGNIKVTLW